MAPRNDGRRDAFSQAKALAIAAPKFFQAFLPAFPKICLFSPRIQKQFFGGFVGFQGVTGEKKPFRPYRVFSKLFRPTRPPKPLTIVLSAAPGFPKTEAT